MDKGRIIYRPAYSLNYLTPKQFREAYMQVLKKNKKYNFLSMRVQNMLTSAPQLILEKPQVILDTRFLTSPLKFTVKP